MNEMIEAVVEQEIAIRRLEIEKTYPDCPLGKKEDILNNYKSELTKRLEIRLEEHPKTPFIELYRIMAREVNYWLALVDDHKESLLHGKVTEPDSVLFGNVIDDINWVKLGIIDDWEVRDRIYNAEWQDYCRWHEKNADLNYSDYKARFLKYSSGLEEFIEGKLKDAKRHGYESYSQDY